MPSPFVTNVFDRASKKLLGKFGVHDEAGELSEDAAVLHLGATTLPVPAVLHNERSDVEFTDAGATVRVQRREIDVLIADLTVMEAGVPTVLSIPSRARVQIGNRVYVFESSEEQEPYLRLTLRRDPQARGNMIESTTDGAV